MFPLIANAATTGHNFDATYISGILSALAGWINMLVPLLIGLAVVVFFVGLVKYIWGGAEAKASAISSMVWGVIAIAVMVSIWGLVGLLAGMAGVENVSSTTAPALPGFDSAPDWDD
jgi:hypothetical protein